jgi:hypothetical protein
LARATPPAAIFIPHLQSGAAMIEPGSVTLEHCIEVLEARRQRLCTEILDYVRPVPACDVDFNTLLAERAELTVALSHLRPLWRGEMKIPHPREDLVAH